MYTARVELLPPWVPPPLAAPLGSSPDGPLASADSAQALTARRSLGLDARPDSTPEQSRTRLVRHGVRTYWLEPRLDSCLCNAAHVFASVCVSASVLCCALLVAYARLDYECVSITRSQESRIERTRISIEIQPRYVDIPSNHSMIKKYHLLNSEVMRDHTFKAYK